MVIDFTHGTVNLPMACIVTKPDSNGVAIVSTEVNTFYVLSRSQLPPVGTWVSMVLIPIDEPNPQPKGDKPLRVKYWDYLE